MTAVWRDDRRRIQEQGLRVYGWLGSVCRLVSCWWCVFLPFIGIYYNTTTLVKELYKRLYSYDHY